MRAVLGPNILVRPGDADRPLRRPGDDYLLALAETARAVLVSGDRHLLELADKLPIQTARAFLETLERGPARP